MAVEEQSLDPGQQVAIRLQADELASYAFHDRRALHGAKNQDLAHFP
jgi:hypothetical protein